MTSTSHDAVIPEASRVLVTGANGFIASNIIDHLLNNGYIVRGTIRNQKPWLDALFNDRYGQSFESFVLPSFQDTEALNRALDGVSGVIHAASDVSFTPDPNAVIPWVVKATLDILEIAARKPSIKRVILLSSSSAAYTAIPKWDPLVIDKNTYNDRYVDYARDETLPEMLRRLAVYAASKTEGEREAWEWIEKNKPHYVFNTILPSNTVGRLLHLKNLSSMLPTKMLLEGNAEGFSLMPEQWFIDVEDIARLCLICLTYTDVKSERIFAMAERLTPSDVANVLRKARPYNDDIPDAPNSVPPEVKILPRTRADEILRNGNYGGFASVRQALVRGVNDLESPAE